MKLCVDKDWLRRQIENDPDVEMDAGRAIRRSADVSKIAEEAQRQAAATAMSTKVEHPLGLLVHQTRRRDRLTVPQFAERIRVAASEVEAIEKDPTFSPRLRTIHNLAEYVKVPAKALLDLLPDAPASGRTLDEAVHKFAASSDDLSALSKAERRGLNDFVKFLTAYKGG